VIAARSSRFAVALVLAGQLPAATAQVTARFHHLHYRVEDPGAALAPAVERVKGTRALLPGLGVGVRVGQQYVLFEREGPETSSATAADAYAEAVAWLAARGLLVQPRTLSETNVAAGMPDAAFDHLAFAVDDLRSVLSTLKTSPLMATDDAARFRLASGVILELVRDTDRPDSHWCPMHPDVRRPGTGTCPRCGMALVPIPPPRLGEYRLDVTAVPRARGGVSGFRLTVRDPQSGEPVSAFTEVHERIFHLFIVSRDLEAFAHVHPEKTADGAFEVRHDLAVGQYMLIADFLPAGGTPQLVQRMVVTPGYKGPLFAPPASLAPGPVEQIADGIRVRLHLQSIAPRRASSLRFEIADAATNQPVSDLEPYLGAAGHLLVVSQDLTIAVHGHPEGIATSGPVVMFDPVFPTPGIYKLWAQFQRRGRTITVPFVITVSE
jgi:Heavy metal binding domain